MATLDELRDELIFAAERILGRKLDSDEQTALVEAYNSLEGQANLTVLSKCVKALEIVLGVDLSISVLLEKAASVDQVQAAVNNLRMVSARSASGKKSKKR